jgi:hypothetical protein
MNLIKVYKYEEEVIKISFFSTNCNTHCHI